MPTAAMIDAAQALTALRAEPIARDGGDHVCPVTLRALLRDPAS